MINILISIFIFIFLSACNSTNNQSTNGNSDEYIQSIYAWKNERVEYLKGRDGWLNLAGLYWLNQGENTVGSDKANTIQFPEQTPAFLGSFILYDNKVLFKSHDKVQVYHKGEVVKQINMEIDINRSLTILTHDSLAWFIIQREDQFGVRLRDFNHPALNRLDSIPSYPIDINWRLEANLKKFDTPKNISVTNVLGMISQEKVIGVLEFNVNGSSFELFPMGTENALWIIFADETSGVETYGGGRYLEVGSQDENGKYCIDFNKAYNPPCAFTAFATCPLPPKENILEIKITGGEKDLPHTIH
ncbi:MAG: DUF1684 domain-containing protein [Bacteroidota bacterium]|nr:DUF1684 domain-containing protein [Bacteroidota bacterium]